MQNANLNIYGSFAGEMDPFWQAFAAAWYRAAHR